MNIFFYISIFAAVLSLAGIIFSVVNLLKYRRVKNTSKPEHEIRSAAHTVPDKPAEKQKTPGIINRIVLSGNNGVIYDGELIGALSVGRSPKNDVVISDPKVSGRHCRISKVGRDCFVEDMSSTNGTYVNDKRIYERTRLKDGDILRLAGFQITVGCQ